LLPWIGVPLLWQLVRGCGGPKLRAALAPSCLAAGPIVLSRSCR
jgi:hypothetical protein